MSGRQSPNHAQCTPATRGGAATGAHPNNPDAAAAATEDAVATAAPGDEGVGAVAAEEGGVIVPHDG